MKKTFIFIIVFFSIFFLSGCATTCHHTYGRKVVPYGGIRIDIQGVKYGIGALGYHDMWLWCIIGGGCVIDLPISAVADTLMYPIDYFFWAGKSPLIENTKPFEPIIMSKSNKEILPTCKLVAD